MVNASTHLLQRLASAEVEYASRKSRAVTLLTSFLALLILVLLTILTATPAPAVHHRSPLFTAPFDEAEHRLGIEPFTKWQQVVAQEKVEVARAEAGHIEASSVADSISAWQLWQVLTEAVRQESPDSQLDLVNGFFNAFRYASDQATWNTADYWATPLEFIARGQGDCEDFATAKYFALRAGGFPAEDLRVAVLLADGRADSHAVLLVRTASGLHMLDYDSATPIPLGSVYGHRLVYSVNESNGWLHLQTRPAMTQTAASRP